MAIDLSRIVTAAAEAYLGEDRQGSPNGRADGGAKRRLGGVGALALGAGLAVAARAAYIRARRFDLERVADRVEDKLSN